MLNLKEYQYPSIYTILYSSGVNEQANQSNETRPWTYKGSIELGIDNWYLGKNGVIYIFSNKLNLMDNNESTEILSTISTNSLCSQIESDVSESPALMLKPMGLSPEYSHLAGTIYYNQNSLSSNSIEYIDRANLLDSTNNLVWQNLISIQI